MLAGFHAMDEHFKTAPLEANMPVIQGMLEPLVQQLLRRPVTRRAALLPAPAAVSPPISSS